MTSKLTREQLHERARENVKALKMASRQTAFESAREEILADLQLAELALAAMDSEPVAFTEKHEISNMHTTGLYLRAWPADRARNAVEGYTIPLYTTPQPISLVNSEPVAYIFKHPAGRLFWALTDESNKGHDDVMPVYARPQPAPEEWTIADAVKFCKETGRQDAGSAMDAWNACRAAMLHAGNSPAKNGVAPAQSGNSPAIPDGYVLVPKEARKEILDEFDSIIDYGAEDSVDAWHRLLAAATQEVKP
ncbi:hypothetical protein OCM00_24535 [Klebsiella pneumoniae]|nr:hypothetical protein OCM00_24535 [Klebsiella pneumoniae]